MNRKAIKKRPLTKKAISNLPAKSAVYNILSKADKVLYIGATNNLRRRALEIKSRGTIKGAAQIRASLVGGSANAKAIEKREIKAKNPTKNTKKNGKIHAGKHRN